MDEYIGTFYRNEIEEVVSALVDAGTPACAIEVCDSISHRGSATIYVIHKETPLHLAGLGLDMEVFPDMSEDEILMILDEEEGELG